ncbi:ParA family protein [Streptococcus intermedius]|uniref:ParA family protein n=1 Tax=Streptococcus intermedius TaxID=1338 RepID=UPI001F07903B|nr:ParA family protein [Streptococcus intermedius]
MTKIYTTNIKKGGVGKTTITFNSAFFLVEKKNKRVLLIDMDDSCNLTKRFSDYYQEPIPREATVAEFFTGTGKPSPLSIQEGMDLIAGAEGLSTLSTEVEKRKGWGYLLSWYFMPTVSGFNHGMTIF